MTAKKTGRTCGTCAQLTALLGAGGLHAPEAALAQQITTHLATCAACGRSDAGLEALLALYRTHLGPPPPELEQRLLDQVCRGWAGDP